MKLCPVLRPALLRRCLHLPQRLRVHPRRTWHSGCVRVLPSWGWDCSSCWRRQRKLAHEELRLRFLQDPPLRERLLERIRQILKKWPESLRGQVLRLQEREQARLMTTRHHQLQVPQGPLEQVLIRCQSFPLHRVVVGLLLHWQELRERLKSSEQKQPIRRTEIRRRERERQQEQMRIHPCQRLGQRYRSPPPWENQRAPCHHPPKEGRPSRRWLPS